MRTKLTLGIMVLILFIYVLYSRQQVAIAATRLLDLEQALAEAKFQNRLAAEGKAQVEHELAQQIRANSEMYALRAKAQEFEKLKKELAAKKPDPSAKVVPTAPSLEAQQLQVEHWVLKAYARTQTAAYATLYAAVHQTNVLPAQLMSPEIADALEQKVNLTEYIARLKAGATDAELLRDYGMAPRNPDLQFLLQQANLKFEQPAK